jgi:hypothetical protein
MTIAIDRDDEDWPILAVREVSLDQANPLLHALPSALLTHMFLRTMCGVLPIDPVEGDDDTDLSRAVPFLDRWDATAPELRCPECEGAYRRTRAAAYEMNRMGLGEL